MHVEGKHIIFVPEVKIVKLVSVLRHMPIVPSDVLCQVSVTQRFRCLAAILHNFASFGH